jgi:hypothetical protein
MQDDQDLEVQYIIDSINKQNKIESRIHNYKLNVNDKVRLVETKKALKKTRYNVSSCYYTIIDISGKSISISAGDGSIKTVTISQIIPIDMSIKIKEAKSIGGNCSSVTEILKYYPKTDSYQVKFDLPDDNDSYTDAI